MKSSKTVKRVLSLVMAVLVVASSALAAPVQKRAAAAASYSAYLCLSTEKWTFRNEHSSDKFSDKLENTTNPLDAAASKAKFTDVMSMKKNKKAKTYSVSLTGLKPAVIGNDGTFNTLFVDTTIPGSMKDKITVTKTFKKAVLTPDPDATADFTQIQIINIWNSRVTAFKYTMPKKSIKVTYTIKFK